LRRTSFFQKKIRQFRVEFAFAIVLVQILAIFVLSDVDFSAKLNAMKENAGMYINNRKPTANKQVEMFFKLTCNAFTSGDVEFSLPLAMSRRTFLEIMNSL
jgi:hypothetical protein